MNLPTYAENLALELASVGFEILEFTEGDTEVDGEVILTDLVSIQVGTYDKEFTVVRENWDKSFTFWPTRKKFTSLVSDIQQVMKEIQLGD